MYKHIYIYIYIYIRTSCAFLEDQWPHFPVKTLVSEDELKRFAENRGGRFPSPQYCPTAVWQKEGDETGRSDMLDFG